MPDDEMVRLDGARGEGGGQILRSALTLSLITGRPFEIVNIRAKRPEPGLRPQHVACARGALAISESKAEGVEKGSRAIVFRPGLVRPGDYLLDVGTAGSVSLLFQTLCFPLAFAGGPSTLRLTGGTHVRSSPTFHYLSLVWEPQVRRLGYDLTLELLEAGFYPEGGGRIHARVQPHGPPVAWDGRSRGMLVQAQVLSISTNLPLGIAGRQTERAMLRLRESGVYAEAENLPVPSRTSKGTMCMVVGVFERTTAGFGCLGERGKPAEKIGDEAAMPFCDFMASAGAVDEHLADQLILPLALAASGRQGGDGTVSRYTTRNITEHLVTNADVVGRFLDVEIAIFGRVGREGEVRVAPRGKGVIETLRPGTSTAQETR
jgi:RNA 3'-terminal phosphate cyclase (ATP)